jgi:hypothetical protein
VGEEGDIAHRVVADAVYETCFLRSVVEFGNVIDFDVNDICLLVCYSLHHDEVLVLAMNRILLDAGVSEGCEELDALDLLGIVIGHVNVLS